MGKVLTLEALELPLLPVAMNLALRGASSDRSAATDMAEVISKDQSLTGNILKIANSEHFGLSQDVPTVSRAILVLGFEAVRSIALKVSVMKALSQNAAHDPFDRKRFWIHSLACAYLARKIAGMTHRAELEVTFACGLLHDIGKTLLYMHFPESYRRVLVRLSAGTPTSVEAEDEILGFTHTEVGMWLAQRWKLPKSITFAIANHHGTIADDERYKALTAIVRLADHVCLAGGLCPTEQAFVGPIENSILEDLKVDHNDLAELQHTLGTRKEAFISLFSN